MMLNTDMGMVFDQNKPLADCFAKAKEANDVNWRDVPKDERKQLRKKLRKSRKTANKECTDKFAGKKSRGLPGVLAQNSECCAWISTGCLAAKKAFPRSDIPEEYCGSEAIG